MERDRRQPADGANQVFVYRRLIPPRPQYKAQRRCRTSDGRTWAVRTIAGGTATLQGILQTLAALFIKLTDQIVRGGAD